MPSVHDTHCDPAEPQRAAGALVETGQDDAGRNRQRHEPQRKHEEHRDQDQLRRDSRAGSDLEVEPEGSRVGEDQHGEGRCPGLSGRGDEQRHQGGRHDEAAGEQHDRDQLAVCEPLETARPALLDHPLLLRVEQERPQSRPIWIRLGLATLAILIVPATGTAEIAPSSAGASYCDRNPVRVFRPWGDLAYYSRLQNGGFESGSIPWLLRGGATVVSGNEPFYISGNAGDSHSLLLPQGSSAYSGTVCFALGDWHLRFMMRNVGSSSGALRVQVVVPDALLGFLTVLDAGTVTGSGTWAPSPRMLLPLTNVVSLIGGRAVAFRFTPVGRNAAYQIDDSYLDPWKST